MITILKFYASWCKPCAILSGRLEEYEDIITNVNIEEETELTLKYHVRTVPTLIFLKNDVVLYRSTGLMTVREFKEILDELNDSKEITEENILAIKVIEEIKDNTKEE